MSSQISSDSQSHASSKTITSSKNANTLTALPTNTPTTLITQASVAPTSLSSGSSTSPSSGSSKPSTDCSQWLHIECADFYTHLAYVLGFGILFLIICAVSICSFFAGAKRANRHAKKKNSQAKESNIPQQAMQENTVFSQDFNNYIEGLPRRDSVGSIADIGVSSGRGPLRVVNPDENDTISVISIEHGDNIYEVVGDEKMGLEDDVSEASGTHEQGVPLMSQGL